MVWQGNHDKTCRRQCTPVFFSACPMMAKPWCHLEGATFPAQLVPIFRGTVRVSSIFFHCMSCDKGVSPEWPQHPAKVVCALTTGIKCEEAWCHPRRPLASMIAKPLDMHCKNTEDYVQCSRNETREFRAAVRVTST